MATPGGGNAGHVLLTIVDRPGIVIQRKQVFGTTDATAHTGLGSAPGAISDPVKIRYFCIAGARLAV
jgi:hypothetical protein